MINLPSFPSKKPVESRTELRQFRTVFIKYLESEMGARAAGWLLLQTGFHDAQPQIDTKIEQKTVQILLSHFAKDNWYAAVHELAHECVHVMDPIDHAANYLEEGIAVWFSIKMSECVGLDQFTLHDHLDETQLYRAAYNLVLKFPNDPLCAAKLIRRECGSLSGATEDAIQRLYPILDMETIQMLCSPFK